MHEEAKFLPDILVILAAAVFVVVLFRQMRLSPVLGFLFAGAAIGPYGFGIIHDVEGKSYLAEFGIVFLLFLIGLELSFKKLAEMRAYVLGLGGLQLLLTTVALACLAELVVNDWHVSLTIGAALALSSTALVLQVLEERGERLSQVGRVSFSVLLLQDLAVVPLLIIVPFLADTGSEDLTETISKTTRNAVIAVVALLVFGRSLLRPIYSLISNARSAELLVATTLLITLGAAYATEYAGLSLALGAFLAGLMVAETQYRKVVEADIMPFKGLLMGLFFMTIGMGFNLNSMIEKLPMITFYSLSLIFVKAVIMLALCKAFKLNWETSIKASVLMSQGGEFAFILFGLAAAKGLLDAQISSDLLLIVAVTMALTPFMYSLQNRIFNAMPKKDNKEDGQITQTEDLQNHFVICGFGWVGENLARFMASEGINFVAVDQEVSRVKKGRDMKFPVYYGDGARLDILRSLKAEKAKAIIVTIHDSKAEVRIIQTLKNSFPHIPIIARAKHVDNISYLKEHGATYVIPEAYESSIQIGKAAMQVLGTSEAEIRRATTDFRKKLDQEFGITDQEEMKRDE